MAIPLIIVLSITQFIGLFFLGYDRCYQVNQPSVDKALWVWQFLIALSYYLVFIRKTSIRKKFYYGVQFCNYYNLLVFVFTTYRLVLPFHYYDSFSKEEWQNEKTIEMAREIVRSEMLIGKNKNEVVEILGPFSKDPFIQSGYDLHYSSISIYWLEIDFDGNVVVKTSLGCFGD